MLDLICIFSTGGAVLWWKAFCEVRTEFISQFIKDVLIEEKTGLQQYSRDECIVKW